MRFASEIWLWGVLGAALLAGILIAQGIRLDRSRRKMGDRDQVLSLQTSRTGFFRAWRGVLSCLAVALAFVAAAQPQYGKGTRVLPATNLDVVLVLDYSKSMYAQDVSPSRIARAKVEVEKMIRELVGARFGAVAFAGEGIAFPMTSDGAAIAQFFRGLSPNDLPRGGTAIARALEQGRALIERDPLSKNHERVMVLITDGEDLEGDPVAVARVARDAGIRVEVVQVGGQSPEPIPLIDDEGRNRGMRKDRQGRIMTTALSPEGEAQLAQVADVGGGQLVRATAGEVGIDEMKKRLSRLMTEELSERVETVYADVYQYPLALALLLLMIEVWIGPFPRRRAPEPEPGKRRKARKPRRLREAASVSLLAWLSLGCAEFDSLFERESPQVNEAIQALQESEHDAATAALIEYLETGVCEAGVIGVGDRARAYSDASYDLALALSQAAQKAKKKSAAPDPGLLATPQDGAEDSAVSEEVMQQIMCARRLLATVGENVSLPVELRARSYFLSGNLELLAEDYPAAVSAYDRGLLLAPGVPEGEGDPIGLSIAYNRALALRLQKEKEEQEKEEEDQNSSEDPQDDDSSEDEEKEGDEDSEESEEEQESKDDESDQEQEKDESQDGDEEQKDEDGEPEQKEEPGEEDEPGDEKEPEQQEQQSDEQGDSQDSDQQPQEAQAEQSSRSRDERMLDLLEQTPTFQQHEAQQRRNVRGRIDTMEDK